MLISPAPDAVELVSLSLSLSLWKPTAAHGIDPSDKELTEESRLAY